MFMTANVLSMCIFCLCGCLICIANCCLLVALAITLLYTLWTVSSFFHFLLLSDLLFVVKKALFPFAYESTLMF